VFGNGGSDRGVCSIIAKATGYHVVSVDYRLGSGNPYPSAQDDVTDVLHWVNGEGLRFKPDRIKLGGVSS
jgi:acetyl esterase/lipase